MSLDFKNKITPQKITLVIFCGVILFSLLAKPTTLLAVEPDYSATPFESAGTVADFNDPFAQQTWLEQQAGNTAGQSADSLSQRQKNDLDAAKAEIDATNKMQQDDLKWCSTQVKNEDLTNDRNQPRNPDDPYSPSNPDSPINNPGSQVNPCSNDQKQAAAYTTANEETINQRYTDSLGNATIGVGHKITGSEPFDTSGTITPAQSQQLFNTDYNTARAGAMHAAADTTNHPFVDWNSLSPTRQAVLTDMAFNMGTNGNGGLGGFNNMWTAVSNSDWDTAGAEITRSTYAGQVGGRATNNANAMRTDDGSILDKKIATDPNARALCGGSSPIVAMLWEKSLKNLSSLFSFTNIANAQLFVPVKEQPGDLMTAVQNTDKTTQEIRNLDIQICTRLRAINRIQARMERKVMIEDYQTKLNRATVLEAYRYDLLDPTTGAIATAGTDINGNPAPLFIVNYHQKLTDARTEEANKLLDEIASSTNDITKDDILTALKQLLTATSSPLTPTLDKQTLTKLIQDGHKAAGIGTSDSSSTYQLSDAEYMDGLAAYNDSDHPNKKGTALLISADEMGARQETASQEARDTAIMYGGFDPIRNCTEKTADGKSCRTWITTQPGSVVRDVVSNAWLAKANQNENGSGPVGDSYNPNVGEILTARPSSGTNGGGGDPGPVLPPQPKTADQLSTEDGVDQVVQQSTQNGNSGNSGTGNGNTGTGAGGLDLNGIIGQLSGLLSSLLGQSAGGSSSGQNTDILAMIQQLFSGINLDIKLGPIVIANAGSPSLDDVKSGSAKNTAEIVWGTPNSTCFTTNDWLSADKIIQPADSTLDPAGIIDLAFPITNDTTITVTKNNVATTLSSIKNKTPDLTAEKVTTIFANGRVAVGDIYTLLIDGKSVTYTAVDASPRTVTAGLRALAINTFPNYNFTMTANALVTTPKVVYKMTCANTNDVVNKTLTIDR